MRGNVNWMIVFAVLIGFGSTAVPVEAQSIIYVDDDAPPGGDGTSWGTAFNYLQDALAAAVPADEIWTAAGTYKPDQGAGQIPGDREASFQLITGVAIYGGLAGDEDPATFDLDDRDFAGNETILTGDLAGDDGPGFANNDENSYHVITGSETAETAVVDGSTITGGNADHSDFPHYFGGGMYSNLGSPTVANCAFIGNTASNWGGGMFNEDISSPALTNCTFSGNTASGGGGMFNALSSPTLTDCTFTRNNAAGNGGGMGSFFTSSPTLISCTFTGNTARRGGGMANAPGNPTLTNCTFSKNTAGEYGGGMYNGSSIPTLTNCMLWGNYDRGGSDESAQIHGGSPSVAYSCIQGLDTLAGEGNIGDDPLLTSNGMHLRASSPCIDAGDPLGDYTDETDIDGEPREIGGRVDMGADEFLDTDGDALPDWWEQLHFGSPTAGVASVDSDNDGRDNLTEYVGDTDPLEPPRTYYVELTGNDDWDGLATEWDGEHGPKATIQAGMDAAHPYEGDVVVVGSGTYTGAGNRDLDFFGKAIIVQSSDPNDPELVSATVIDCEGTEAVEHRAFWFHSGEGPNSVVAGFTVTGGYATDGGAVSCILSSPMLSNCTFSENSANGDGGGMYNSSSSPTLANCAFIGNTANGDGGGMRNEDNSSPTLTNCDFSGSTARRGGALYNDTSSPMLTTCTFSGNTANDDGGGMYVSVRRSTS